MAITWNAEADRDLVFAYLVTMLRNASVHPSWDLVLAQMVLFGYETTTGALTQRWSKVLYKDFKDGRYIAGTGVAAGPVPAQSPAASGAEGASPVKTPRKRVKKEPAEGNATPKRAKKATPAKGTPAKATPVKGTPAKATPKAVAKLIAENKPAATTPVNEQADDQSDEAVKDGAATNGAAKDVAAKDVSAKDVAAKDVAAEDVTAKDVAVKNEESSVKEAAPKNEAEKAPVVQATEDDDEV